MGWVGLKSPTASKPLKNGVEYHGLGWFEVSSGSHPPPANRSKNGVEYHGLGWFEVTHRQQTAQKWR
jgi:hypothetical protein